MTPKDALKNAFPNPDDSFVRTVQTTLFRLQSQDSERKMLPMKNNRKKVRFGVCFAAAALLLTSVATFAGARLGLFDFTKKSDFLPEAENAVQTQIPQTPATETAVTFSVREAVYDGSTVMTVIEAKPSDPSILLIGEDTELTDPAESLGLNETCTVEEYAKRLGKSTILRVNLREDAAACAFSSMDWKIEGDNLVLFLSGRTENASDTLSLVFRTLVMDMETQARQEDTLSFTLTNNVNSEKAAYTAPAENPFEAYGFAVTNAAFSSTPMGVTYTLSCHVTDQSKWEVFDAEGGLYFRILDANGEPVEMVGNTTGELRCADANGDFFQTETLVASFVPGDTVTVSAMDVWNDKAELGRITLIK